MSTAVRQILADAASTVAGIEADPFYVQSTEAGHAHIRLEKIEWPNRFGQLRSWNVVVLLPQDIAESEAFLEEKLPLLYDALSPELIVREAVPQRLNIPGIGDLPCVFINGQREE